MKKIRINELARELEVKAHEILDRLPELGVTEKKTHSSSIDEDVAIKLRRLYGVEGPDETPAEQVTREPDFSPPPKAFVGDEGSPWNQLAPPTPEAPSVPPGPVGSPLAGVEQPAPASGAPEPAIRRQAPIRPPIGVGRPVSPPVGPAVGPQMPAPPQPQPFVTVPPPAQGSRGPTVVPGPPAHPK